MSEIKLSSKRCEEIKRAVVNMFVHYGVSCIPINGFEIASKMGVRIIPYSAFVLSTRRLLLKKSEDVFSLQRDSGEWIIYYNDAKRYRRIIKKQDLNTSDIKLIACSNTKTNDCKSNTACGVHFFVDDYRFNSIYNRPERTLHRYSQYAFMLSPDFSTYSDMNLWRQLESVAKNRWVGAFWQSKGLTVIPTISWGLSQSFDFCFEGVEQNSIVAVGMIGCKQNKLHFLRGYNAMLEKISPSKIICFGRPYTEMGGNIISIDYTTPRKVA